MGLFALYLHNQFPNEMETSSLAYTKSSMLAQVAGSRSNEWMISSYNAWQQRSPLRSSRKRTIQQLLKLVGIKG